MSKFLDMDLKSFVSSELNSLALNINYDPIQLLPKKSEDLISKFLKDPKGELCVNEDVHYCMHKFIRKARRKGFTKFWIAGAFSMGKSLCKGNQILTYDCGYKNVEDIKVGDLLIGPDSTPRKVLALGKGKEQSYKITLKNKDSFSCNKSHKIPFIVSNRYKNYRKGDQVIMTIQDYLKLPEYAQKNCFKIQKTTLNFEKQEIPIHPYLYGLWLGDGHKNGIYFTINNKDKRIVEFLYKWANKNNFEVRVEPQKGGNSTRYDLSHGPKNSKSYMELDFIKKNHINGKRIDKRYLFNSKWNRLKLLAGLLDTDGYLSSKCFEIATKWIGLRDDILFLCRSLGFSVSHRIKYVNDIPYYVIIISGNTHLIPCKTRKKSDKRLKNKNPLVYGFDIEDIGEQEYYGFVLDGDHLYLQDDFTVHHNSEQICIGFVLDAIARNPDIFTKIVHVSEKESINRVRAIGQYIQGDEDYKRLCPHIQPSPIFGQEKFIVQRKSISLNPTVQAFSVLSSSLGGRANLIIFDDINDLKSAVLEPTTRENIELMVKTTWETRCIPNNSEIIGLGNIWHENDIFNYIKNNPTWSWMTIAVSEDKNNLEYNDCFRIKKNKNPKLIPLWTKFPKEELINRHISMGDRDYNRGFRLIAYSDKDKSFPSFESCCEYYQNPIQVVGDIRDWIFAAGVDFSSPKREGTIMVVGAMHRRTGIKIPIEVHTVLKTSDLAQIIINTWQSYGIEMFLCENNSVQSSIIDLLQSHLDTGRYSRYNIKLEGFCTGKNKADPNQGIPSIQKEMERGEWKFYFERPFTTSDNVEKNLWYRLYTEMKYHPFYKTTDLVMGIWFLRESFKQIFRQDSTNMIY
jgi:hypothetical protein